MVIKLNNDIFSKSKFELPIKTVDKLEKMQYGIFGHSGVQVCSWTKKSFTDKGVCYKERFYGIDCHSCCEMSPTIMWCQQNCTFCWRPMEYMKNVEIDENVIDSPEAIVDNLILKRRKLISGYKGNSDIDMDKFDDAQIPTHYSISLSGEPTMYPKLNEMVKYMKSLPRTRSIFIVSNGQLPEYFETLVEKPEYAPTQLYISIDAPNPEIFDKVNKSLFKDGWERLNSSLVALSKIDCRTVLRMTQIKGLNDLDEQINGYVELIEKAKADIIEVKAYMHIGLSRNRHSAEQMPSIEKVREFAEKLAIGSGNYEQVAEMKESKIVLLRRKDSKYQLEIENFEN